MSKFELTKIPIKKGAYQKPERQNRNIPDVKYVEVRVIDGLGYY